jgi:hypothetical protein
MSYSIKQIHQEFVPKYDRWNGKISPRVKAWFSHIVEIIRLWVQGDKPYVKHDKIQGTCRDHAKIEIGDLLYLTAEIIWMVTGLEFNIVPKQTLIRVWKKFEENKSES